MLLDLATIQSSSLIHSLFPGFYLLTLKSTQLCLLAILHSSSMLILTHTLRRCGIRPGAGFGSPDFNQDPCHISFFSTSAASSPPGFLPFDQHSPPPTAMLPYIPSVSFDLVQQPAFPLFFHQPQESLSPSRRGFLTLVSELPVT